MSESSFVRNYALTCYTFEGDPEDYFIAKLLHKYVRGKRILDLGCGPVVPVTTVFYPAAEEVVAVDRLKANLDYVRLHSEELVHIIQRAKGYKHKYLSKKDAHPRITLKQGDVAKKMQLGTFDTVINLGAFGALNTEKQFFAAVQNAHDYLKKGGTLLMINWVGGVKRPYQFNGKVNEPYLYVPSMKAAGFKIQQIHQTSKILSKETKKMGYNSIIWAVAKK